MTNTSKRKNIVLFDNNMQIAEEFIKGLEIQTNIKWTPIVYTSNGVRANIIKNLIRYIKFFIFPFSIFLKRRKYDSIIAWQPFYGILFAFYCQLFHVKKVNKLILMNLIYVEKKGLIGKVYFKFLEYVIKGPYVDVYISASETYCDHCAEVFKEDRSRFKFAPFGVIDYAKSFINSKQATNDYVIAIGRSNRDYDFLVKTFKKITYPLYIVCDELKIDNLPDNIKIFNDKAGLEAMDLIRNSKCMIIPIKESDIDSGDTVLLQAMLFSKPVIVTIPSCLADDYVSDGETGLLVNKKEADLINAVDRLYSDTDMYNKLTINCRKLYEEKYSLYSYGCRVGELFNV